MIVIFVRLKAFTVIDNLSCMRCRRLLGVQEHRNLLRILDGEGWEKPLSTFVIKQFPPSLICQSASLL